MTTVLLLILTSQLVLPLELIAWLAFRSSGSRAGWLGGILREDLPHCRARCGKQVVGAGQSSSRSAILV